MRPEQFRQVRRRRDAKEVVSEVERAQRVVLLEAVAEVRQALGAKGVVPELQRLGRRVGLEETGNDGDREHRDLLVGEVDCVAR